MAKETIIKRSICGSTSNVESHRLPMWSSFNVVIGKNVFDLMKIEFEVIDICAECLSKCTNIHDKRVQGKGEIIIENNPEFNKL